MAINYRKKNWIEGQTFDPDTMNYLDGGIQQACDGVDALANVPTDLARNGYGEQSGTRNLFNPNNILHGEYSNNTYSFPLVTDGRKLFDFAFKNNTQYTFSGYVKNSIANANVRLRIRYTDGTTESILMNAATTEVYKEWVSAVGKSIAWVYCDYSSASYGASIYSARNFQIEEGTVATSYEPYYESNKMLTEDANEIASLKFLGWTVPREMSVKNSSRADGGLNQRVGRVDLGSLNYNRYLQGSIYLFDCVDSRFIATENAYCSELSIAPQSYGWGDLQDKSVRFGGGRIRIRYDACTDATAFKNAMSGKYLYYPLDAEVVIAEGEEVGDDLYKNGSAQLVSALTSGEAKQVTIPQNGFYFVLAINNATSGNCSAYMLNASNSVYISASETSTGAYHRCTTAPIPLKKGTTITARAIFADQGGLYRLT